MTPRLLFVDFAPLPGGSVQSLLLLIRHLPRQSFSPVLLLSPTVASLPEVQALDIPVFALDARQGRPQDSGRVTAQVQASSAAAQARHSPVIGAAWRSGSIARRLWSRTRPVAAATARIIGEQGIDLVHLNDSLPLAEPGIVAAWRARRPSIVLSRSFARLDVVQGYLSRVPAAGVFTSAVLAQDVQSQGARFRRQHIVANAVDLAPYAAKPDRMGVRQELGLAAETRIVAVAGRIMRRKGLDVFIRAMTQVCAQQPQACGLIIGEVDQAEPGLDAELRQIAEQSGVADRILFTGYRADVPRLLLASDLLCFVPSEPEPFGRTVIEAMAAGLPVIGARSGALPDIIIADETGLLVPPGDAAAQADAILHLLQQPDIAAAFGRAGRKRASAQFGIVHQVEQMTRIYDEILHVA